MICERPQSYELLNPSDKLPLLPACSHYQRRAAAHTGMDSTAPLHAWHPNDDTFMHPTTATTWTEATDRHH